MFFIAKLIFNFNFNFKLEDEIALFLNSPPTLPPTPKSSFEADYLCKSLSNASFDLLIYIASRLQLDYI